MGVPGYGRPNEPLGADGGPEPGAPREELLPRGFLVPGERVVFEAQPSFWRRYAGRLAVLLLLVLIVLAPVGELAYDENPFLYIFEALFLGAIVYLYVGNQRTVYALTDRRVLRVVLRSHEIVQAAYPMVARLSVTGGISAGVRFDLSGPVGRSGSLAKTTTHILWDSLPDAEAAYRHVQWSFARQLPQNAPPPPRPAVPVAPPARPGPNPAMYPLAPAGPPPPGPSVFSPTPPMPLERPAPPTPYRAPPPTARPSIGGMITCPACGLAISAATLNPALPQCPRCLFVLPLPRSSA